MITKLAKNKSADCQLQNRPSRIKIRLLFTLHILYVMNYNNCFVGAIKFNRDNFIVIARRDIYKYGYGKNYFNQHNFIRVKGTRTILWIVIFPCL